MFWGRSSSKLFQEENGTGRQKMTAISNRHPYNLSKFGSFLLWIWGIYFLKVAFGESSATHYRFDNYLIVAVISWAIGFGFFKVEFLKFLKNYRSVWLSVTAFSLWIMISEEFGRKFYGNPWSSNAGYQAGLILCWPMLTVCFANKNFKKLFLCFLVLVAIWHFFAVPIEGFTGKKLTWHSFTQMPGGFGYQASGLAFGRVYFAGFYIPLFFTALGALATGEIFKNFKISKHWVAFLCLAWLFPAVCCASRSGLIGATLGGVVLSAFFYKRANFALWAVGILSLIALLVSQLPIFKFSLFARYSGDFIARFSTLVLYIEKTSVWPSFVFGHGSTFDHAAGGFLDPPSVGHSHNDWVETYFLWGLPAVIAYFSIWFQILKLMFFNFKKSYYFWPVATIIALFPNLMTDLGFTHFEKAQLIGFLLCLTIVKHSQNALISK